MNHISSMLGTYPKDMGGVDRERPACCADLVAALA
ncbi:hypothetical protein B0G38_003309 [Arthrobacter sp. VKM Ac-2550]|nr:hypothetical protein [Arthrobacter sp. VKM Ac-2550]